MKIEESMIDYWYRDKNGELKHKTENQIIIEGTVYVGIGMLIALLISVILK